MKKFESIILAAAYGWIISFLMLIAMNWAFDADKLVDPYMARYSFVVAAISGIGMAVKKSQK